MGSPTNLIHFAVFHFRSRMEGRALCVFILVTLSSLFASSHGDLLHSKTTHRFRKPLSSSSSAPSSGLGASGPNVFFEVSQPVEGISSPCSTLVMQHAFAYTYSLPPAVANYTPPSYCGSSWDRVILKWSGTCKGRQYDRIAAVWFGGVEVLRTCTAEPTSNGIYWEVRKDVTRFISVFKDPQIVAVELANVVDSTYTGIFNINITLEFYASQRRKQQGAFREQFPKHEQHINGDDVGLQDVPHQHTNPLPADHDILLSHLKVGNAQSGYLTKDILPIKLGHPDVQTVYNDGGRQGHVMEPRIALPTDPLPVDLTNDAPPSAFAVNSPPDLIVPIAKPDAFSSGYWFELSTENETASVTFNPPKNIYRAVLEVCVSFHGNDEFWYTNPPNDYLEANGLSGYPGNGPFREVQVFLDDVLVGAVWPFPVVFTGGINPLFWRPAAAIGAYNLPSYDLELTPFVGLLVDGNNHTISMRVENADGSWPLDANLHLWLDPSSSQTMGGLLSYDVPMSVSNTESDFEDLDGTFHTTSKRTISYSGYIICSLGNLLASASYAFAFDNVLVFQNSSSVEIVMQETHINGEVLVKTPSKVVFSQETTHFFPFYMSYSVESGSNSVYTEECNLTHAFNQEISTISSSMSLFESLKNSQAAQGDMTVVGSSVTAGVGALQQHYNFDSTRGCYDRLLSTKNYSILYDIMDLSCEQYKAK